MLVSVTTTGGQSSISQGNLPWSQTTVTSSAYTYNVTSNASTSWWNETLCTGLIPMAGGQPAGSASGGCQVGPSANMAGSSPAVGATEFTYTLSVWACTGTNLTSCESYGQSRGWLDP